MIDILKNMSFRVALLLIGGIFIILGLISDPIWILNPPIQDTLGRIASFIIGTVLVVVAIYLERQNLIVEKLMTKNTHSEVRESSLITTSYSSLNSNNFIQISEQAFLKDVDLSKVRRVSILGHTGSRIYSEVHERFDRLRRDQKDFQGEVRILTRTPLIEGLYRNDAIHRTLNQIRDLKRGGIKVDVRFYESVPAHRGIICELDTNDRISYLTSYYWPMPNRSKAFDFAYVIKDSSTSKRSEVNLLESWFDHFWGRDEIHTIVFDFDDTLVATGDIQIKAWAQVIEYLLGKDILRKENLSTELQNFIDNSGSVINRTALQEAVREVFVDKQLAEIIIQDLFVNLGDETIKRINNDRFDIREKMMDQAPLFRGVKDLIHNLSGNYNLAIISSTDEEMITNYLKERELLHYFPIILGKKDPGLKLERENIYGKTSLLIKLSEIIGIPLSRLVYVGDNNSDYLATRQLQIAFIEARQAAKLMGKTSLIGKTDPNKPPLGYFESFEDDRLPLLLREHSRKIAEKKYQI